MAASEFAKFDFLKRHYIITVMRIELFGWLKRQGPSSEDLRSVPGFQVLGRLSGEGNVAWPEDFEKLATVKQAADVWKMFLPDEEFGFGPGSGVRVIGRAPRPEGGYDYILRASDRGDPVFIADASKVERLGFDPNKFNFQAYSPKRR